MLDEDLGIVLDEDLEQHVESPRPAVAKNPEGGGASWMWKESPNAGVVRPPTAANWMSNILIAVGVGALVIGATIVYVVFFQGPSEERAVSATTTAAATSVTVSGERRISQGDYGDRWPFTVSEGVLCCVTVGTVGSTVVEAVYFRVGATTYPINGVAKGRGGPGVEAIWKTFTGREPKAILARLPEPKRRELFRAQVACPEQAERAAGRKFPGASSLSDLKSSAVYEDEMMTQCYQHVRAKDKLTEDELELVVAEGYARQWPPTKPVRPTIGPIIDDGLKLCSR